MRIAVDAMGGDDAPRTVVHGAVAAAREDGLALILVGARAVLEDELARFPEVDSLSIAHSRRARRRRHGRACAGGPPPASRLGARGGRGGRGG